MCWGLSPAGPRFLEEVAPGEKKVRISVFNGEGKRSETIGFSLNFSYIFTGLNFPNDPDSIINLILYYNTLTARMMWWFKKSPNHNTQGSKP